MEIAIYHFADGSKKVFVDGREAQKEKDFSVESFSGAVYKFDPAPADGPQKGK